MNQTGDTVSSVKVRVEEKRSFQGHCLSRSYETDKAGRFEIQGLPWGTYVVMVRKEDSGYPDACLAIYSNLAVPTATISAESPETDVRVKLGPIAGWLSLAVVDAVSGKQLDTAVITLRRVAKPNFFMSTSTTMQPIAVPSLTDVSVEISAPGYKK